MRNDRRGRRRRQRGVSLLEAVTVVALSGSLTAIAAPQLNELFGAARAAVVGTLQDALRSASTMAHLKCAVQLGCDLESGESSVRALGAPLRLVRGYPAADASAGIERLLDAPGFIARPDDATTLRFLKRDAPDAERCAVVYRTPERDGGFPIIEAITSGC